MEPFEVKMRRGGSAAIREAGSFFMHDDPVHRTLREIARKLEGLGVPYAVAGGMALVAHGYDRTTEDVDILTNPGDLKTIHEALIGLGYQPPFAASKNLRDSRTGGRIKFLLSGQYPGDGKPKPIAFPQPSDVSVEIDGIRYLGLPALIELKLASGMTNPSRLRDLADVLELIRVLPLGPGFAEQLHPYVRAKFMELHSAVSEQADEHS